LDLLTRVLSRREKIGRRLEQAEAEFLKKKKRKEVRDCKPFFCLWGEKVDAIQFFERRFDALSREIDQEQQQPSDLKDTGCAFVTFADRVTAQVAAQCVLKHDSLLHPLMKSWACDAAPAPMTVLWKNLWVPHMLRWMLSLAVNAATFVLIFFWMIPVGFASSVSNLTTLSQVFPFLIPVFNAMPALLKSTIEGILPALAIIIFFAILVKFIITPLCLLEGQWSRAIVDRAVFNKFCFFVCLFVVCFLLLRERKRFYLFQVFNVFLGSIVASGILTVLPQIASNPANAINLLAKSLPPLSNFFRFEMVLLCFVVLLTCCPATSSWQCR
jgi:calcium permeable stress-gated cation channel